MARKFRLEYAGAICHVMNRGDQRAAIFIPMQRGRSLETKALREELLAQASQKLGPNDLSE